MFFWIFKEAWYQILVNHILYQQLQPASSANDSKGVIQVQDQSMLKLNMKEEDNQSAPNIEYCLLYSCADLYLFGDGTPNTYVNFKTTHKL